MSDTISVSSSHDPMVSTMTRIDRSGPIDPSKQPDLQRFCRLAAQTLRAAGAIVTLGTGRQQLYRQDWGDDFAISAVPGPHIPASFLSEIAAGRAPAELHRSRSESMTCRTGDVDCTAPRSAIGVALRDSTGNFIGMLIVLDHRMRKWSFHHRESLTTVASLIESHIEANTKVADIRAAQSRSDLVVREMSHRMSNVFTVVSSLVTLSAHKHPESTALASTILGRIEAFAAATKYVMPKDGPAPEAAEAAEAELHGLIRVLSRSYDAGGRIVVRGGNVPIKERAALVISLVIHELGTNALKYGSLSVPDGSVVVECEALDGRYRVVWRELGGPAIASPPTRTGFGSKMCRQAIAGSLEGTLTHHWETAGLTVVVDTPLGAFGR